MTKPKISIIVPVYNMGIYLDQTIQSLVSQTLSDIEMIYIDDASNDDSKEILRAWAGKDSRIKMFGFSENQSAWSARIWGVREAMGEYIMFADADDTLQPSACEELYEEMKKDPTDILHFRTNVINVNHLPQEKIDFMNHFLQPYSGKLYGKDVLTACFSDAKYRFSLWNKVFNAKLCKKALSKQEFKYLPKGQDKLAYFLLAYNANSYRGIGGKQYYNYFFGRGGTGIASLTDAQFERNCTSALVADELKQFLLSQGIQDEYKFIENKFRNELLADCMSKWCNNISADQKSKCFDLAVRYWGPVDVVSFIAGSCNEKPYDLASQLRDAVSLKALPKNIKTIAAYSHSLVNGGQQRVFCELANMWEDMGYKVLIITDNPPDPNDYELSKTIKRIIIPNYQDITLANYKKRALAFADLLKENDVDLVVYHPWVLHLMLWDELIIKASGASFIIHCHSVFSLGMFSPWVPFSNITAPYLLADGVVVLSETDKCFWEHYNNNVHVVNNPISDSMEDWTPSACQGHNILWLARLSDEKSPFDLPAIMKTVVEHVPDAKLDVVGSSKIAGYEEELQKAIDSEGLHDSIILRGFTKDVKSFYEKADVFLMTSEYEGYGLTLQEAMLSGLPVVMYDLPYLTLVKDNKGIVSVGQHDTEQAARKIIELLLDEDKRKLCGQIARKYMEEAYTYDFRGKWESIFISIKERNIDLDETGRLMMETLVNHHDHGLLLNSLPYGNRKAVKMAVLFTKALDTYREKGFIEVAKKVCGKIRKKGN